MNARTLLAFCVLISLTPAVSAQAPVAATSDGLVAVRSWNLDELYLRPNADL